MGTIKTTNIETITGSGTLTLGQSGETITIPSGVTITNNGTQTGFGGDNTPAFHTYFNSSLSISTNTSTKITPLNEVFDTNSAFATDKFTVPTGEGGKYFIYATVMYNSDVTYPHAEFYVNGSGSLNGESLTGNLGGTGNRSCFTSRTLTLSAGDYVELYTFQGSSATSIQNSGRTFFGGYKLIT